MSNNDNKALGGGFLFQPVGAHNIFNPAQFNDEHKQLFKTVQDFINGDVIPRAEELDHKKPGLMVDLIKKAGELGFLMVDVPEKYEGLELDKTSSMLVAEGTAPVGSFAVTIGAHTGIGTLPIIYYGTDAQKQKYLPKLASGEYLAAYCLSEQSSGSDALSAKTLARKTDDGYTLNGTKAWITNGGFADIFIIFAQIVEGDEHKFTAFIVEKDNPGLSIGKEEKKLGIRGSSTTLVILDDCKVPADAVLGEIGKGHKIAFNILNIGRFKLGIAATGGGKYALAEGCRYAMERKQFKKPIGTFGMVREKIAKSAMLLYATESMAYRLAGYLDEGLSKYDKNDDDYFYKASKVIEEYTIEASILKVFGSEVLAYVADEMLQVHGGNGFTEDYPIERIYRDERINRIYEGTNEINRLIIPATMFKRALKGQLPIMQYMQEVITQLNDGGLPTVGEGLLADEIHSTELCKRAIVYASSYAAQKYMNALKTKQRILGEIADACIALYAMDSVVTRALQNKDNSTEVALAKLYVFEARADVFQNLRRIAMAMYGNSADNTELDTLYDYLAKLDQRYRCDVVGLQEEIAQSCLDKEGYPLDYN